MFTQKDFWNHFILQIIYFDDNAVLVFRSISILFCKCRPGLNHSEICNPTMSKGTRCLQAKWLQQRRKSLVHAARLSFHEILPMLLLLMPVGIYGLCYNTTNAHRKLDKHNNNMTQDMPIPFTIGPPSWSANPTSNTHEA